MGGVLHEIPVKDLIPLATYPITDPRIAQLHELVSRYGVLRPLIVTEDRYIVDGNKLHTVMMMLGHQTAAAWVLEGTRQRHPLDFTSLQNLHSILNLRLPYTYASAIDPMLDTLRLELTQAIISMMPETMIAEESPRKRRGRGRPRKDELEVSSGGGES